MQTVWKYDGQNCSSIVLAIRLLEWRGIWSAIRICVDDRHATWSDKEAGNI